MRAQILMSVSLLLVFGACTLDGPSNDSANSDNENLTVELPSVPTGFSCACGDRELTLSWDAVPNSAFYNLYSARYSGLSTTNYEAVRTVHDTSHIWTELTNYSTYYFVVTGENSVGEGPHSPEINGTPRDPFALTQYQRLYPADAGSGKEHFGSCVAIWGDYAIVGAHRASGDGLDWRGAAYVFHQTDVNEWDTGYQLLMASPQGSAEFGRSVSISGDYLVAGAPRANGLAGTAYVYKRIGTNEWDSGTELTAPIPEANDEFGSHVAISGEYVAVANSWDTEAYIFHRTGTTSWDGGAVIVAPESVFAYCIAIGGDYVVVGAPGAAFVFHRTGVNSWDSGVKLVAPDPVDADSFGSTAAVGEDLIVVGAPLQGNGGTSRGSAYVFNRTGANSWDGGAKLLCPDLDDHDFFGCSVAISDNLVAVGAYGDDEAWNTAGAFYIFERWDDGSWDTGRKIIAPDEIAFGRHVAISGLYVVASAPGQIFPIDAAFAVYAFER